MAARIGLVVVLVVGLALTRQAWPAGAAGTWYVATTGSDGNSCTSPDAPCLTIARALYLATAGGTVSVAAGTYTETMALQRDVQIVGAGAYLTILAAPTYNDVGVQVPRGTTAALRDMAVISASAGISTSGALTLQSVEVRNNGNGVYNTGTLLVEDSTIAHNYAVPTGGGIYNTGVAIVRQSTVVLNKAWLYGAGIWSSGVLSVTNSTMSQNQTMYDYNPRGGGVYLVGAASFYAQDTILSGNIGGDCTTDTGAAHFADGGYNITSASCFPSVGDPAMVGLWYLQNYGGGIDTMTPNPGGSAIDAGNPTGCTDEQGTPYTTDQRGYPRPAVAGGRCDVGAVEMPGAAWTPVPTDTPTPVPTLTPTPQSTTTPGTLTLAFPAGWTLAAFPLVPAAPLTAQSVLAALVQSSGGAFAELARWTGTAWVVATLDHGQAFGDFTLTPAQGYFLYTDQPATYVLTGQSAATGPQAARGVVRLAGIHGLPPLRRVPGLTAGYR